MDRDQVQNALAGFFAARVQNRPEDVLEKFAQGACVRMAGASEASPIAHSAQTKDELHDSIFGLVSIWQWHDIEILATVIEDNTAAVRYQIKTTHVPTGSEQISESMDQFYFDESGKIIELIEFVDTALVAQIEKTATG
ncbi:MAG: hypothetical protein AAF513_17290 [Pseudomonadota bacterium]